MLFRSPITTNALICSAQCFMWRKKMFFFVRAIVVTSVSTANHRPVRRSGNSLKSCLKSRTGRFLRSEERFIMGRNGWSLIGLVILLATNMILLQYTIESYMVYDHASMRLYMIIAVINVGLIGLLYRYWKKNEYRTKE